MMMDVFGYLGTELAFLGTTRIICGVWSQSITPRHRRIRMMTMQMELKFNISVCPSHSVAFSIPPCSSDSFMS